MANSPESARSYSSPPSPHSIAAQYGWSPNFIQTGAYQPITGNWIPQNLDANGNVVIAIGSGSAALSVTGSITVNSGFYGFTNLAITGSQTQIPVGVMSWSVFVESGFGYVNNVLYNTFENLQGGGYDGNKRLSTPINVGGTGSAAAPTRILINYES